MKIESWKFRKAVVYSPLVILFYKCRFEKKKKNEKLFFNCLFYLQINILQITNVKTTN